MAGRGHYYESNPFFFLSRAYGKESADVPGKRVLKTWTLYDSTGNYFSYLPGVPKKPLYDLNYDSVYHLFSFTYDSAVVENKIVLHREPISPGNKNRFLSTPDYLGQYIYTSEAYSYRFDRTEKKLRVYDRQKKLYKTFRVVFVTADYLVLELIQ